jgi:NAD(P)-dependent dehydrogenase (short-subunit alcohol dehydrogenase family)
MVSAMTAAGFCASAVSCDGTRADDLEAAVAHVVDGHGALHVLVNSAGIAQDNLDHKLADDEWHGVIATNLTGSFFLARAAQRPMVRQRRGRLRSSAQPLRPAIAADQLLGCQGGTVGNDAHSRVGPGAIRHQRQTGCRRATSIRRRPGSRRLVSAWPTSGFARTGSRPIQSSGSANLRTSRTLPRSWSRRSRGT